MPPARASNVARVRLVGAVREVETKDVGAGGDQRIQRRVGIAGRADGGDDLRMTHLVLESRSLWAQIVPDAIEHYLAGLNRGGDPVLDEIARGNATRGLPLVDAEVGALLRVLATAVGASRILEIGTAIGYSGIWLAGALPPAGMLVTMEFDEGRAREARENFARAGVGDRVSVVVGDAQLKIAKVSGPFDLIFQDGDKKLYSPLLDRLVGAAAAGRTAGHRQRAVGRRSRARLSSIAAA